LRLMDAELWRFYLLYNRPEGRDVNFSWEELEKAVNGVLISNVANLINRVLSFVQTQCQSIVPAAAPDVEVDDAVAKCIAGYESAIESGAIGQALRSVCDLAVFGNEYFHRKRPWASKDDVAVAGAVRFVKTMAVLLLPYLPTFAASVLRIFGIEEATWDDVSKGAGGARLSEDRVLLDRIDIDQIREAVAAIRPERSGDAKKPVVDLVSLEEFKRLDLRVAKILDVGEIPGTTKLYRVTVDVGQEQRTCVAGIRQQYEANELIGRTVVAVVNLEPVEIRGVMSECMILAATDGTALSLLEPNPLVEPGSHIS
jgi:methionyl-tRNA synthetase